jgi:hypothetical protein
MSLIKKKPGDRIDYLRDMSTADLLVKFNALPAELQKEVGDFVDRLLKKLQKHPEKKERPLGMFKGKIHVADDFDGPLEDFGDLT